MRTIIKWISIWGNVVLSNRLRRIIHTLFPALYHYCMRLRWNAYIRSGDTVVQAGVDMGWKHDKFGETNAVVMSKRVGKNGKVIAIEPDVNNVNKLKEFLANNGISNVIVVERALWKKKMPLRFYLGKRANDNQLVDIPNTESIPKNVWRDSLIVEADTLDNILEYLGISFVSHVCLTINGAEYEALKGMDRTLGNNGLRSLLIAGGHDFRPTIGNKNYSEKIAEMLKSFGFKTHILKGGWSSAHR